MGVQIVRGSSPSPLIDREWVEYPIAYRLPEKSESVQNNDNGMKSFKPEMSVASKSEVTDPWVRVKQRYQKKNTDPGSVEGRSSQ